MTANDHADCGSADSEFSSQVLLTLTGPVPQAEAGVEEWKFSDNVFKNIKFSYKAGCSCGCSPGFILDGRVTDGIWNSDIHLSTLDGLKEVK